MSNSSSSSGSSSSSSGSSSGSGSRRVSARELIQYPEAKRVTKKTAEENVFPCLVNVELLRLSETCGVCLGDFSEDVVASSPSVSGAHTPEEDAEKEVVEVSDGEEAAHAESDEGKDPLRDIGLLSGCTHTYHFFCIEKWGKQRENSCPQCKLRFSWIGRYSRSGRRICCCRVGLKHQKDTAEAPIVDYVQLQLQQQQLCQVCSTIIESSREELRCSDQLCQNSFHFICAGFDELPQRTWFCPHCRASGICRDADSRRVPRSRISPDGFLLPPRPRGRRVAASAAAAAGEDEERQLERQREELVESLSSEVVRRINRRARQSQADEEDAEEPSRRRSVRGRRNAAAASSRRGGRRQQRQQQEHQEDADQAPEGRASSAADIDYRRQGAASASAAAAGERTAVVHPHVVAAAEGSSEAPRMLRFYLGPKSPVAAAPRSSNSWLLQRKLDIIRLRKERREALRRQETLRRMEEQAKVVCSGVSVENPSGAALVEDLLQHHDQLVRRHSGTQQLPREEKPAVAVRQSEAEAQQEPHAKAASVGGGHVGSDGREEASGRVQEMTGDDLEQQGSWGLDEGCSLLELKCEELLKQEADRRCKASDDMIRAQILLDIDRARTKLCDEAARAATARRQCGNSDSARQATDASVQPSAAPSSSSGGPTESEGAEAESASAAKPKQEDRADRCEVRRAVKRRHEKIKPSQALVDRVKSCMKSFMLERYPDRNDEYRCEYKRICRHVSESLTKRHEGPLLLMSEAERSQYWAMNVVQVQTAVQDYFEGADEPLE